MGSAVQADIRLGVLQFLADGGEGLAAVQAQPVEPGQVRDQPAPLLIALGDHPPVEIGQGIIKQMGVDLGAQGLYLGLPAVQLTLIGLVQKLPGLPDDGPYGIGDLADLVPVLRNDVRLIALRYGTVDLLPEPVQSAGNACRKAPGRQEHQHAQPA